MTKNGDSLTSYLQCVKLYKEKAGLLHNYKEKKFLFFIDLYFLKELQIHLHFADRENKL